MIECFKTEGFFPNGKIFKKEETVGRGERI